MTDEGARLLPWTNEHGNPCILFGDGTGHVSRVADEVEEGQLAHAADLVDESRRMLASRMWTSGELQLMTVNLTKSLGDVHRIAESRGARLALSHEPALGEGPGGGDRKDAADAPAEVCSDDA